MAIAAYNLDQFFADALNVVQPAQPDAAARSTARGTTKRTMNDTTHGTIDGTTLRTTPAP